MKLLDRYLAELDNRDRWNPSVPCIPVGSNPFHEKRNPKCHLNQSSQAATTVKTLKARQ